MNIEDIDVTNIKGAVHFILKTEKLQSKQDLDIWCGDMGRKKIYLYVERLAPEHWSRIQKPMESVRSCYEKMLPGYKIYNGFQV